MKAQGLGMRPRLAHALLLALIAMLSLANQSAELSPDFLSEVVLWALSLADAALRWASPRTSSATTANPRPASPAREASTAAFSASRLVCSAIWSITPITSSTRSEPFWIVAIIWAFLYNRVYTTRLLERGYVFDDAPDKVAEAKRVLGVHQ